MGRKPTMNKKVCYSKFCLSSMDGSSIPVSWCHKETESQRSEIFNRSLSTLTLLLIRILRRCPCWYRYPLGGFTPIISSRNLSVEEPYRKLKYKTN